MKLVVMLLLVLAFAPSQPPSSTLQSAPTDGYVVPAVEAPEAYYEDGWWKDMWDWIDTQLRIKKPPPSAWRSVGRAA